VWGEFGRNECRSSTTSVGISNFGYFKRGTIWLVATCLVQKIFTGNKLIQHHNFVLNKYINISLKNIPLITLLSVKMAVS